MKQWYENYGADADGNRGVKTLFWELDGSDQERSDIAELITADGHGSDDEGMTVSINYEDIEMDVEVDDYIDEIKAVEERDLKQEIETFGFVKFEEIAVIYKSKKDQYKIGSKPLDEVAHDLKYNKYTAIPF